MVLSHYQTYTTVYQDFNFELFIFSFLFYLITIVFVSQPSNTPMSKRELRKVKRDNEKLALQLQEIQQSMDKEVPKNSEDIINSDNKPKNMNEEPAM